MTFKVDEDNFSGGFYEKKHFNFFGQYSMYFEHTLKYCGGLSYKLQQLLKKKASKEGGTVYGSLATSLIYNLDNYLPSPLCIFSSTSEKLS